MALADIINPVVTTNATGPTAVGFGIPMVLAYHTNYPDRARSYTSTAAMVSDGFLASEPATAAVGAIMSQTPKPKRVIVGRAANDGKQKITLTPVAQNLTEYTVTINGQDGTFTSDATGTLAEIIAGLKIAIDALSQSVTVTDNTSTTMTIEANAIANVFTIHVNDHNLFKYEDETPDAGGDSGIADDIIAVANANDEWYTCHPTNKGKAVLTAAAVQIGKMKKLLLTSSADTEIYDSTVTDDIASTLQTANHSRTAIMFHPKASSQYPGAAWAGKILPYDPGSVTWMFKTLTGVDTTTLTDTQSTNIKAKDCNMHVEIAGATFTQYSNTCDGSFIDLVRTVDWIVSQLQIRLLGLFTSAKKVPYTDAGVQLAMTQIRAVFEEGISKDAIASDPEPVYTYPLVKDVSLANRQSRNLPDIQVNANFSGAIHSVGPLNVNISV
ncbi:MAG: DUF3383 domain-containing protein [FCB group bacterium]|nr:DUF3383 domain-containing protein [FCB group bacterium]